MAENREPTGPGWFTIAEYSERYQMSVIGGYKRLISMHKKGLLDRWCGIGGPNKRHLIKYRVKT